MVRILLKCFLVSCERAVFFCFVLALVGGGGGFRGIQNSIGFRKILKTLKASAVISIIASFSWERKMVSGSETNYLFIKYLDDLCVKHQ